jgi:predicted transcriptional regulator
MKKRDELQVMHAMLKVLYDMKEMPIQKMHCKTNTIKASSAKHLETLKTMNAILIVENGYKKTIRITQEG